MLFLCKRLDGVYGEDLDLQCLQTFMSQVLTETGSLYKSREVQGFFSVKFINTGLFPKCMVNSRGTGKRRKGTQIANLH